MILALSTHAALSLSLSISFVRVLPHSQNRASLPIVVICGHHACHSHVRTSTVYVLLNGPSLSTAWRAAPPHPPPPLLRAESEPAGRKQTGGPKAIRRAGSGNERKRSSGPGLVRRRVVRGSDSRRDFRRDRKPGRGGKLEKNDVGAPAITRAARTARGHAVDRMYGARLIESLSLFLRCLFACGWWRLLLVFLLFWKVVVFFHSAVFYFFFRI